MTDASTRTEAVLDVLRRRRPDPAVFKGFGPLVVGLVFLVLMIALLPSVAPEHIVEEPVQGSAQEAGE